MRWSQGIVLMIGAAVVGCHEDDSVRSGTLLCLNESQCQDLPDCEHVTGSEQGACVMHCVSDADCGPGGACIVGADLGLDASCFPVCTGTCSAGYSCFEYDPGLRACLPAVWLGSP